MTTGTLTRETSKQLGSIYNIGDRVAFKYYEDEDGIEYGYGTVHSRLNDETAVIKIVLEGRKKPFIDYHEVAFKDLMPHIPDKRRQINDDED